MGSSCFSLIFQPRFFLPLLLILFAVFVTTFDAAAIAGEGESLDDDKNGGESTTDEAEPVKTHLEEILQNPPPPTDDGGPSTPTAPTIPAHDVAALIACLRDDWFPSTGEPMRFPIPESMTLETPAEIDEWLLRCLSGRSISPQMEAFLTGTVLETVDEVNRELIRYTETRLSVLCERSNITLEIQSAPNKKALEKAQFEGLDRPKMKLQVLRLITELQREAYVSTLGQMLFANETLVVEVALQLKKAQKGTLDVGRYQAALDRLHREAENSKFLLQDAAGMALFEGLFDYGAVERGLATIVAATQQVSIVADGIGEEQLSTGDIGNSTATTMATGNNNNAALNNWWTIENPPKTGRVLYLVRHAERLDNAVDAWMNDTEQNPLVLRSDNTPLSERGQLEQADALGQRFRDVPIDHLFASPMDRTMDTASRLLAHRNGTIRIKVEPGLIESLYRCEQPPSCWTVEKMLESGRFPLADPSYIATVFTREELAELQRLGNPGEEDHPTMEIATETLRKILETQKGKTLVFVTHSATIGALHQALTGHWTYVAQGSVSKFVEVGGVGSKRFRLEYSSDTEHFGEGHRRNTRAF